VSGVIRVMMIAISDMMGKPPTESVFFEKYSRIACVIDEIVNEVGSSTESQHRQQSRHQQLSNLAAAEPSCCSQRSSNCMQ